VAGWEEEVVGEEGRRDGGREGGKEDALAFEIMTRYLSNS